MKRYEILFKWIMLLFVGQIVVSCGPTRPSSNDPLVEIIPPAIQSEKNSLTSARAQPVPKVFVQSRHSSYVNAVAFSPDGQLRVVGQ